jgi:hypothetical protein
LRQSSRTLSHTLHLLSLTTLLHLRTAHHIVHVTKLLSLTTLLLWHYRRLNLQPLTTHLFRLDHCALHLFLLSLLHKGRGITIITLLLTTLLHLQLHLLLSKLSK